MAKKKVSMAIAVQATAIVSTRLQELETIFEKGMRHAVEALKEIKDAKLYKELGHQTFESYMEVRWCKTRQWGYQQLTWLKAVEALEHQNVKTPLQNLSVDAAQTFRSWENRPDVFVAAYEYTVANGEEPNKENLEKNARVQADYLSECSHIPDLSYKEFEAWKTLGKMDTDWAWQPDAKDSFETVLSYCKEHQKRPTLNQVAKIVRGEKFLEFVKELQPIADEQTTLRAMQDRVEKLKREKREKGQQALDALRRAETELNEKEIALGKVPSAPPEEPTKEEEDKEFEDMTELLTDILKRVKIVSKYAANLDADQLKLVEPRRPSSPSRPS